MTNNHIRIQDDKDYIRPEKTKQDLINENKENIRNRLKNWILVPADYLDKLDLGIWIRYVSANGKFRSGGIIIKNSSPDYIVLKNPKLKVSWSVDVKKNYLFIQDIPKKQEEEKMKEVLYQLWKKGDIELDYDK